MNDAAVTFTLSDLTSFQEVLKALNAHRDVSEAFPTIFTYVRAITGCDRVSLILLDKKLGAFVVTAVDQTGSELAQGEHFPLADSAITTDLLDGRIHVTPDMATENELPIDKALFQAGYRSRVNIPLIGHKMVMGALNLGWLVPHGLDMSKLPILTQVTAALALAVERHLLVHTERHHLKQMRALQKIGAAITSSLNLDEVLDMIAQQLLSFMEAPACMILLLEPPDQLVYHVMKGIPDEVMAIGRQPADYSLSGWVIQHGQPLSIDEMALDPRFRYAEMAKEYNFHAYLGVPMQAKGKLLGVLEVMTYTPRHFSEAEIDLAMSFASQASIAIENARLYAQAQMQAADLEMQVNDRVAELRTINEKLRQEVAERTRVEDVLRTYQRELEKHTESLATINAIADSVYRSFDLATVVNKAVTTIMTNSRFTTVALFSLNKEANILNLAAYKGFDKTVIRRASKLHVDHSFTGCAVKEKTVVFSNNLAEDNRLAPGMKKLLTARGYHSIISVPILFQDKVLGAFTVTLRNEVESKEEDQELLLSIGKTIGLAMANAEFVSQIQTEIYEREQVEAALKVYAADLERSNRELQDFAYVASHDLQEPLRKIQTFADRLQGRYQHVLDERGNEYLRRMQTSTVRMRMLIDDLLAFSRVTTAAEPFVEVGLTALVQEVVADLEAQLERTGGQITVETMPDIEAEPVQMRRLVQNLISNALKFHRPGVPPQVRLWAELVREPGGRPTKQPRLCRIFVADNGIGFEEKYRSRIFNLFERLHGRTEYEGTGMGLAICRRIVEHHAGHIEAQSVPGEGATFIITLPVKQDRQAN